MEKGNLRADVNVSCGAPATKLGTRCEIKNVNSIRFIGQAIEAEARRQIDILEDGGSIQQETRLFDSAKGVTRSMRSKEEAHDYRYFPDPDLLPLELTQAYVDGLKRTCQSCPTRRRRASCASTSSRPTTPACWWPSARAPISSRRSTKAGAARWQEVRQWVINELIRAPEQGGPEISARPVSRQQLGAILD
jgi:aspartyl-tRNA(Asn)/glutamyl-tRNA(Gln) amidotransferase subunit B